MDHIALIFSVLFFTTFTRNMYLKRSFAEKLEENKKQIVFQEMASDISAKFTRLNHNNFDHKMDYLLDRLGNLLEVDRTFLFTIDNYKNIIIYSNEWCAEGVEEALDRAEPLHMEEFPWLIEQFGQFEKKDQLSIVNVDQMSVEAKREQEELKKQGIKSMAAVPVYIKDELVAFLGIASIVSIEEYSSVNIELTRITRNILASGMTQMETDKEIEFMAYYDDLTELANRNFFQDRVTRAVDSCGRVEEFFVIIFIDLDNFKTVNDTIGHRGGDQLLRQVAKELETTIEEVGCVARFGGDEFLIIVNGLRSQEDIENIGERIMDVFSDVFTVEEQEFIVTASAGIAVYPEDGENSESLMKNAEITMYEAKLKGKNQYAICSEEIKKEVERDLELVRDLSHALEREEFTIHYQPQVELKTAKIIGLEALLRWEHPVKGMVSPGEFIPLAEKNHLINSIGEWVFEAACRQNKKWQEMGLGDFRMAINLSAVQMIDPKIVEKLETIIEKTGIDPKCIELEITEGVAIQEADHVIRVLNRLKELGVSIAIDDFGTEYSSFTRLKALPIDQIKIDMQFIQGIEENKKDRAITRVIIKLAKSLGMSVLAEGVETKEQLDYLKEKECDCVQGYYYYRPMPAEELEKILAKEKTSN